MRPSLGGSPWPRLLNRTHSSVRLERRMRQLLVSTIVLVAMLVASAAASAEAPSHETFVFEGKMALATWQYCDAEGCFDTTASVYEGTYQGLPIREVTIIRQPAPVPTTDLHTRAFMSLSGNNQYQLAVSPDLSTVTVAAFTAVYGQSCTAQFVCAGASVTPLTDGIDLGLTWTATEPTTHPLSTHEMREVDRFGYQHCRYKITLKGIARDAVASISGGWPWPLGTPTSAWIGEGTRVFTRTCWDRYP
jgi:hypothetical protein